MDNGHEVVDSIPTITVSEERQKIVTKVNINRFALVGMFIGILMLAGGLIIANFSTGMFEALGQRGEIVFGYAVAAAGVFMFCFFGMNAKTTEIQTEPYTVEKQIPIDGLLDRQSDIKKREELIDTKVNAMAAVFEKLAFLTSEIEEKLLTQENARISAENEARQSEKLAQATASAVAEAMMKDRRLSEEREAKIRAEEEERRKSERVEESEKLIARFAKREEELKSEKEEFEKNKIDSEEFISAEKQKIAEEREKTAAEKQKAAEEFAETRKQLAAEKEKIDEDIRLYEEKKKADEEAARLKREREEKRAGEIRMMEAARKALEEERAGQVKAAEALRIARNENIRKMKEAARIEAEKEAEKARFEALGLSATAYAWSSELRDE